MNPRALALSAVAHAAVLLVLFVAWPASSTARMPRTIQVSLASLPRGATAAPARTEERQPKPELEPEKTPNRPRDAVVKVPEQEQKGSPEPEPEREPAAELEQVVGAPDLAAGVAVDDVNFEFSFYLVTLRNRIGKNWSAPAGLASGGQPVRATVYFRVERDGRVVDLEVENSSGIPFFDQTALRAVRISDPVPPLPIGYGGSTLGVHFVFEYTGR